MDGSDLSALQRFVAGAVRGAGAITAGSAVAADADRTLRPSATGMAPHERLEVYREQFWLRHLASLAEDYPTLTWVLGGADAFRALATDYLLAFPPRTWDLQRLGADVPSFVAAHERVGGDALAVDAARLDWAFMEAFDAADSPPFDTRVLASTPEDAWPSARIELHASVRMLACAHPVQDLRGAARQSTVAERPAPADTRIVVYRDAACFVRAVAIDPTAFGLLGALHAGTPLGQACETAAQASGKDSLEIGAQLGGWFQQWTASGWIRAVGFTGAASCHPSA